MDETNPTTTGNNIPGIPVDPHGYGVAGVGVGGPPSTPAVQKRPVENIRERRVIAVDLKGGYLRPSMRETFIVDEYLKCFSYGQVALAYRARFGKEVSAGAVRRWMGRGGAEGYLKLRMGEQGVLNRYTGDAGKALWLRELLEYREGMRPVNRFTIKCHEMIGHIMGYAETSKDAADGKNVFNNIKNLQIRFTQSNGEL